MYLNVFFVNNPSTTEIYTYGHTLSLHDALPISLRGMARRLQFVTAHARAGEELNLDWKAMADPDATLVVYMGRAAAAEVAERLIEAGLDAATPVMSSEERRVGKECVSTCRSRWSPCH